ncbi:MAG: hypothetical protein ACYSVY_12700 [Planctomycetota bacterium]|jgi:hypothetical protein
MQSFIEDFFELVDQYLADPHTSRRYPKSDKLRDLSAIQIVIWEILLKATGQESSFGKSEATITLQNDEPFYLLPGQFRQFIKFERWNNGNRDDVLSSMGTIPFFHPGPGCEIMSEQRGMEVRPTPDLTSDQDWTLTYLKGPILLHHATADGVGDQSIQLGTPATDAGELITTDDYYNGSLLRVYSADVGAGQTREVLDYDGTARSCVLRHPWTPKPTGTVKYEVRPALPPRYDHLYAIRVALRQMSKRRIVGAAWTGMKEEYKDQLNACLRYVTSNVADRGPTRTLPMRAIDDIDPYGGGEFDW